MAISEKLIQEMVDNGRSVEKAEVGDKSLGPLNLLPGVWKNTELLKGFGFNMIALPFADGESGYRLMMNQYDEELHFSIVDKGVPNRGIGFDTVANRPIKTDQTIVALDYEQKIVQIAADDFPKSGETDKFDGLKIHKEPGLWLYMTNQETTIPNHPRGDEANINIARLGTIPHGNSILAVGSAFDEPFEGLPNRIVPNVNGVVVGGGTDPNEEDLEPRYFAPYKHFHENPFKGKVTIDGFKGFEPVDTTELLRHTLATVLPGEVKKTMRLHVDSTMDHAGINTLNHTGILNIPFVVRQADAISMNATFLIYEVEDKDTGKTRHFMQYVQNVILDFIGRPDGHPGRARWPHVSINTMERVSDAEPETVKMRMISK